MYIWVYEKLLRGSPVVDVSNRQTCFGLVQWCRSWKCKCTPKAFDLSKIWAKSKKIRVLKFRHFSAILMKLYFLLWTAQLKVIYQGSPTWCPRAPGRPQGPRSLPESLFSI